MNRPSALVYSTRLPVSVYGTGLILAFLGSEYVTSLRPKARLNGLFRQPLVISLLRHFY
jgi:hypothetical protein